VWPAETRAPRRSAVVFEGAGSLAAVDSREVTLVLAAVEQSPESEIRGDALVEMWGSEPDAPSVMRTRAAQAGEVLSARAWGDLWAGLAGCGLK
jgi:hypothetical protein